MSLSKIILFCLFVRLGSITLLMCWNRTDALCAYGWRKTSNPIACNYGIDHAIFCTYFLTHFFDSICCINTNRGICRYFYDISNMLLMLLLLYHITITIWRSSRSHNFSIRHCCTSYWTIFYTSISKI